MSDSNALPVAGWYPDPENEAGDRWWNGATWSDHRRPRNAGAGWAPAAAEPTPTPTPTPVPNPTPTPPVPPVPSASGAAVTNPYAGSAPGATQTFTGAPVAPPYAPAYAYNIAPRTPMQNAPAFAGMLTSLIGLLFNWILFGLPGIVGGVISIVGLRKANALAASGVTAGNGRGWALTGIISGFVGALLWNLFYFSVFAPLTFS